MKKSVSTDLTPENIATVLDVLAQTPQHLQDLSAGLSSEQLQSPLGAGERSFMEDVAHLLNCESRAAEAIYSALIVTEPLMVKIHPERQWGKLLRYEQYPLADLLAYFTFRRTVLLRILNDLSEKQWARVIREDGKQRKESVYWQARGLALHEDDHIIDLTRKLSELK